MSELLMARAGGAQGKRILIPKTLSGSAHENGDENGERFRDPHTRNPLSSPFSSTDPHIPGSIDCLA